jgi:hypothetical protein
MGKRQCRSTGSAVLARMKKALQLALQGFGSDA